MSDVTSVDEFTVKARRWLETRLPIAAAEVDSPGANLAVFHNLPHDEELLLIRACADWQREKYEAGFGAIAWPIDFGGAGLTGEHERAFQLLEKQFEVPSDHELRRITTNLVAPTVRDMGSDFLRQYIRQLLACELLVCQLFSEPGAGSDLAGLSTRATRSEVGWTIAGSKVWVSGAQFADFGLLLARTDSSVAKHAGITAFLLPMESAGVEIRPIQQMTGGASFNEVFFNDVVLSDEYRLGEVGEGWTVASKMLSYERNQSGSKSGVGGSWEQLQRFASDLGRHLGPCERDLLVTVFTTELIRGLIRRRADIARSRGEAPGPEGSIGKLLWANSLSLIGDTAAALGGPGLIANSSADATYAWSEHVLGALGFHIAGGTDEIQRNIIAERILGLPRG